jgi:hypothetical protein
MVEEVHWDHWICEETLEAVAYSRFNLLVKKGVAPQTVRLFAVTEIDNRRELARRVGADEALLARLEWIDMGECGVGMRLVLDNAPHDLPKRFIAGFEALPERADIEALLS